MFNTLAIQSSSLVDVLVMIGCVVLVLLFAFMLVVPLFGEQILNISSQIHHLTEARDRLLPKLMGGEIITKI